jgi:transposase
MKAQVRQALTGLRSRMLTPVIGRFDQLDERLDATDALLAQLVRRIDDLEVLIQSAGARVSTLAEAPVESEARILRRVEEIERLLGARTGSS